MLNKSKELNFIKNNTLNQQTRQTSKTNKQKKNHSNRKPNYFQTILLNVDGHLYSFIIRYEAASATGTFHLIVFRSPLPVL